MLAITNLSKVPLRLVTFSGFVARWFPVLVSLGYLVYKLIYWHRFSVGVAHWSSAYFSSCQSQMLFHGHYRRVHRHHHTLVQETSARGRQERINFEYGMANRCRRICSTDRRTYLHDNDIQPRATS